MLFDNAEDDDFCDVKPSKHLSSLFHTPPTLSDVPQSTLQYTAPKQPNKPTTVLNNTNNALPGSLLSYRAVEVCQVLNNEQHPKGKCGLAVIGNHSVKSYEIVMYKNKHDILTRIKIGGSFEVELLNKSSSVCFPDEQNRRWLLGFETDKHLQGFVHEIKGFGAGITESPEPNSASCKNQTQHINKNQKQAEQYEENNKEVDVGSDSSSSVSHTKADILTRLAKMGQQILPINPTTSQVSDSNSDSESDHIKNKLVQSKSMSESQNRNYALSNPDSFISGQQSMMEASSLGFMNMLIAENRTHNCELRMNVSDLSQKLNKVLEKISSMDSSTDLEARIKALEKQIFDMSVAETQKESDAEVKKKNCNLKEQNQILIDKICELEESVSQLKENNAVLKTENKSISCLNELKETNAVLKAENDLLKLKMDKSKEKHEKVLKECMTQLYDNVIDSFEEGDFRKQLEQTLARGIRKSTYQIVEQLSK